jgi:predicted PurR-regulated permease PerM
VSRGSIASGRNSVAIWILAVIAALWFLRTARTLLIPIALAVLVSYALEPIVAWLERRRLQRMFGAAIVLLLIVGGLVAGGFALRDDVGRFVQSAPEAITRAREMVTAQLGSGAVETATGALGAGSSAERGEPTGTSGGMTGSMLQRAVSAVLSFAGHLVVIVFLVFFLLMSGHQVRDRLVEVAGSDAAQRRTTADIIDEINTRIQRYLLVLLVSGAIVGAATWLTLEWMGTEHAPLWGLLAGIFNSIPYFGPVIVSGGLLVVGLVQGDGFNQALAMAGAATVITSLEGWLITPPLMGKVERMSALTVFLGLLLWTWIWGAWGTVLAVPMLAIVKAVADHVERLRPVARLMAP